MSDNKNNDQFSTGDRMAELKAGRQSVAERDRKVMALVGGQGDERKAYRFDKERIVLGSVVSADIRLSGDGVAPIHAVVEIVPEPMLYDLASDSGVFLNGKKIVAHPLKTGDEITVGRNTFKFAVEDRAQAASQVGAERVRWIEGQTLFLPADVDFASLLVEEEVYPIFDYRPAQKSALEVVMAWHDTVLDIEHFVAEQAVTIGVDRKNHFGIPPLLSASNYPLLTRSGDDFILNLDRQMKGVMQRKGKLLSIGEMLEASVKGEHGYQIPLQKDDFAKIKVGEIDFFLSFTQAPPKVKRGRVFEADALFRKIFSASLVLTALMLYGVSTMRVVPTLEAEQIPERLATILYAPEKYAPKAPPTPPQPKPTEVPTPPKAEVKPPKPTPKPTTKVDIKPKQDIKKPIPKEMDVGKAQTKPTKTQTTPKAAAPAPSKAQGAAKEGEGAKAKGDSGTRGTKNAATDKDHQNKAKTPSPEGGKGQGSSNSQTADIGNVDFLKGAEGKIENILSGAGARLGKGGDTLKGLGGFDTRGNGGLAISGAGKGGGGTSDLSQGLGNKGRGFGRVGTGLGAAGNGNGIIGGQARVAIRSGGPEEAVVMGSIDADAIEAAMLAHKDEFRLCYEKEINAENPNLAGRVGTTFVIGSGGRVTEAGIESTTLKNANVERCVLNVIKRIDFPIPRGGGVVQVTYPFKYSPVGK